MTSTPPQPPPATPPPESWPGAAGYASAPAEAPASGQAGWPGAATAQAAHAQAKAMSSFTPSSVNDPELPARRVAPSARVAWTIGALLGWAIPVGGLAAAYLFWEAGRPWTLYVLAAFVALAVLNIVVVPQARYRIHRWDVTPAAIYHRHGWLTHHLNVIPLNRVQTVESSQGVIERRCGVSNISVSTASTEGTTSIQGLPKDTAEAVVAYLTIVTGQDDSDAT